MKAGSIVKGDSLHPALDAFLRTVRSQREILGILGIRRPTRQATLSDYLASQPPEVYTHVTQAMEAMEATAEDYDK